MSKCDYTLKAIHCMYSRSRKVSGRVKASSRCRRRREEEEQQDFWGRAWIDMYEAASQAGGGRVQGQARRRRQTPVLEERNAREDGMDSFAIDREFGRESGSGGYARDEAAEMAWNGAAAVWRACTYT